jgi:flagellar basal body-associated protein FliL
MAEANPKTDDADEAAQGPKRKKSIVTLGIFGGVMLVEGIAIFACMKFFGADPDPTLGLEATETTTQPWEESQELEVADLRVLNTDGRRAMLYNVRVVIRVHHSNRKKIEEFLESRRSTIEDAMSRVIRRAEERHLAEPGLETLRRQLRFELGSLLGDESIIEQVLIPGFTPLPTGF